MATFGDWVRFNPEEIPDSPDARFRVDSVHFEQYHHEPWYALARTDGGGLVSGIHESQLAPLEAGE